MSNLGNGVSGSRSPSVTFQDAFRHFRTAHYLEQHMSHIKPTNRRHGLSAVAHFLLGPPRMNRHLHNERNLIFALALCMFRNDEPIHINILMTIYKRLTGTSLDCPRYGNHWELIGFQGGMVTCNHCSRLYCTSYILDNVRLSAPRENFSCNNNNCTTCIERIYNVYGSKML